MDVVAYEGTLPTTKLISWGTAALLKDGRVWNPATGRSCTEEAARKLAGDGHLAWLPISVAVEDRYQRRPLVAAAIRVEAPYANYLLVDTGRLGGLLGHARALGFQVYVFADQTAFDRYAGGVIDDLLHRVLFGDDEDNQMREQLVRVGLTLHSGHPYLLATWVHLAEHDAFVEDLARASLRGESRIREFDDVIAAFRALDSDYEDHVAVTNCNGMHSRGCVSSWGSVSGALPGHRASLRLGRGHGSS